MTAPSGITCFSLWNLDIFLDFVSGSIEILGKQNLGKVCGVLEQVKTVDCGSGFH